MDIRNFSIIAHIDAGKSTLADRLLELTGALKKSEMRDQVLDQMDLERERGITIKMQPCTMDCQLAGKKYQLNLIDTPGHMDFAYEVERSLAAVEGAVLLVDVVKGVQAQTLANLRLAKAQKLAIVPVINKIDICPSDEQLSKVKQELVNLLGVEEGDILLVSAKTGQGVDKVLEAIIEKLPPPPPFLPLPGGGGGLRRGRVEEQPLQALVFDSFYDNYQGVVALVRLFSGQVQKGDLAYLINQQKQFQAREVGILKPKLTAQAELQAGQIGYLSTGLKEVESVRIGETISVRHVSDNSLKPLPGYREVQPLVFANLFPDTEQDFELLKANLEKLRLNDTALSLAPVNNPYLGRGLRVGFLGLLHLEITLERLKREFGSQAIVTSPSVVLKVYLKGKKAAKEIYSAGELPQREQIEKIEEPWVSLNVITPSQYLSKAHQLLSQKRAVFQNSQALDNETLLLRFKAPLAEIIEDFLDKLKSLSQGFASFAYQLAGYRESDLVRLDFLLSGELKPSLSKIVHQTKAEKQGRAFLLKLKEHLPPKNFSQSLQAVLGGKIIAREDIRAVRKDVTAPLYGGDVTRKRKLLARQKKGKKELKAKGRTPIPQEVYLKLIRK